MQRRDFNTAILTGFGVMTTAVAEGQQPEVRPNSSLLTPSLDEVRRSLGENVPANIAAVIQRTLCESPTGFDTDWNGTFRIEGILKWSQRGLPQGEPFAKAWLDHHLKRKDDDESWRADRRKGSRVIKTGLVQYTTYAGYFGVAFPCFELYEQTKDPRARQICLDVADMILHVIARDKHGLIGHDDESFTEFAIPDVAYFGVRALMIASTLDAKIGSVYRRQAVDQLRLYTRIFLDRDLGLAKTALLPSGLGETYWCRASGWLMWAMTSTLRHLPAASQDFADIVRDLEVLSNGVARAQGPSGGLRVLVNDQNTPEETSGTAMCVAGIHEAMRRDWLTDDFTEFVERGWRFVQDKIGTDGVVSGVYTGWAMPAERKQMSIDHKYHGWIPGLVMNTADEMLR